MVVGYLDRMGVTSTPLETNAPLVIDADAVLTGPVALQLLKPVAGRFSEVFQRVGRVQDQEFSQRRERQLARDPSTSPPTEDGLCVSIGE